MTYHDGEKEVQARAGVRDLAERVGRIINRAVPPVAAAFISERQFVIVSTVAADGLVTASLLGGEAGFGSVPDELTVSLAPRSGHLQQVRDDVAATGLIAILAIDFATRRRMRVNGIATLAGDTIRVTTREVYSNCPQYIHDHSLSPAQVSDAAPRIREQLEERHRKWIENADTFFIASVHPEIGADASHRGGPPGFAQTNQNRLTWADYPGNNMFNTLGNLAVNSRAGLLFVDFETGSTLQLQGHARVGGDLKRVVEFDVSRIIEKTT